jgi:transcriptional regulator with XRE-family HTH domain
MVKPDTDDDRRRKAEFAKRLVQFRTAKRWSQSDLWRRVVERLPDGSKFHRTSISRYESGTNIPAPHLAQVVAEVLGVSVEQLLPSEDTHRTDITSFAEVGGGVVRLTVDKLVPYDTALQVLRLLQT